MRIARPSHDLHAAVAVCVEVLGLRRLGGFETTPVTAECSWALTIRAGTSSAHGMKDSNTGACRRTKPSWCSTFSGLVLYLLRTRSRVRHRASMRRAAQRSITGTPIGLPRVHGSTAIPMAICSSCIPLDSRSWGPKPRTRGSSLATEVGCVNPVPSEWWRHGSFAQPTGGICSI